MVQGVMVLGVYGPKGGYCPREKWGRGVHYSLPPILTSSGGYRSGRYASYWNAFLFHRCRGDCNSLFS